MERKAAQLQLHLSKKLRHTMREWVCGQKGVPALPTPLDQWNGERDVGVIGPSLNPCMLFRRMMVALCTTNIVHGSVAAL